MNDRELYYFISRVLALGHDKNPPSDQQEGLRSAHSANGTWDSKDSRAAIDLIRSGTINWKKFVFHASNNFVLQTLYLKFLQNDLTGLLPANLVTHLKNIHGLNLERNEIILDHIRQINDLLKQNDIIPIFMKGAGNMLDGLYSGPGERIMSDIDILTGPAHMEEAARLLMQEGYSTTENYDPARAEAMKHYPVLRRDGLPATVDIHRLPVNIQYAAHFSYEDVCHEKKPARSDGTFMIMSDNHKIKLSFFHSQLVHWGHQHARPSLRELYDLLLLSGREDPAEIYSSLPRYRGKAAGYLKAMHQTFGIKKTLPLKLKGKGHGYLVRHNLALKSPLAGKLIYKVLRGWRLYFEIPLRSLFSKNYRVYVKVRLKDPEWYKRNIGIRKITRKRGSS